MCLTALYMFCLLMPHTLSPCVVSGCYTALSLDHSIYVIDALDSSLVSILDWSSTYDVIMTPSDIINDVTPIVLYAVSLSHNKTHKRHSYFVVVE
jgi:hypothetical protein